MYGARTCSTKDSQGNPGVLILLGGDINTVDKRIREEYTDVVQVAQELGLKVDYGQMSMKHIRWLESVVRYDSANRKQKIRGLSTTNGTMINIIQGR